MDINPVYNHYDCEYCKRLSDNHLSAAGSFHAEKACEQQKEPDCARVAAHSQFRPYFERETTELPQFYVNQVRKGLGPLWEWLPKGALHHDPNAYLKSEDGRTPTPLRIKAAKIG